MADIASLPQVGRQKCPKCDAEVAKAATVTLRVIYLRCSACGDVGVIPPERREFPRASQPQ